MARTEKLAEKRVPLFFYMLMDKIMKKVKNRIGEKNIKAKRRSSKRV